MRPPPTLRPLPLRLLTALGAVLLLFLPRYRGREEDMAGPLKAAGVRDHALSRGFGAVRGWIGEMLRRKSGTIANS